MNTEKVWGTTSALVVTPLFEMHRLRIKPEMRCSLHVHRFKWNAFYVLAGKLFIDSCFQDFAHVVTAELDADEFATVAPGTHHQFRTGASEAVALEMYYTEPLSEDIIRRNVGGPA